MPNMPGQQVDDDSKESTRDDSKIKKALRSGGRDARQQGQEVMDRVASEASVRSSDPSPNTGRTVTVDSYRKGGKVRRTGPALLHRGERVMGKKKGRRGKRSRYVGRY
jgi:hypothetical protein